MAKGEEDQTTIVVVTMDIMLVSQIDGILCTFLYGTQTYDKSPNCPVGFSYSQRIYTTSADGGNAGKYYVFDTKLEGQDLRHFAKGLSGAKPFTLSFYVKCNINRVFTCELRDLDNNRMCVQQYTTTDSNWKRYVHISNLFNRTI